MPRCSFAVEEVRRRVAELLSRGAEIPPPPETPLALYHVHVLSRARGGREALLRLRYRCEGASGRLRRSCREGRARLAKRQGAED
eukprot:6182326-Pleurochrysis_carterae.AAC.1